MLLPLAIGPVITMTTSPSGLSLHARLAPHINALAPVQVERASAPEVSDDQRGGGRECDEEQGDHQRIVTNREEAVNDGLLIRVGRSRDQCECFEDVTRKP